MREMYFVAELRFVEREVVGRHPKTKRILQQRLGKKEPWGFSISDWDDVPTAEQIDQQVGE